MSQSKIFVTRRYKNSTPNRQWLRGTDTNLQELICFVPSGFISIRKAYVIRSDRNGCLSCLHSIFQTRAYRFDLCPPETFYPPLGRAVLSSLWISIKIIRARKCGSDYSFMVHQKGLVCIFLRLGERKLRCRRGPTRRATGHLTGRRFVKDGFPWLHRSKGPLV